MDAFRVYSVILILFAHVQYFGGVDFDARFTRPLSIVIVVLARATIQFFFIAAGYFTGGQMIESPQRARSIAWDYTRRLGIIFIFWSVIYELLNPGGLLQLLRADPLRLIFEGTRLHLWYLPALILSAWLFALWPFDRRSWTFPAFAALLFTIGLLGGAYSETPIGIENPRDDFDGLDDPLKEQTVRWQSEILFYRHSEIRQRARLVNSQLRPDLVLCLHFNAEAWGDESNPTFIDKNHLHLLVRHL